MSIPEKGVSAQPAATFNLRKVEIFYQFCVQLNKSGKWPVGIAHNISENDANSKYSRDCHVATENASTGL